MNRLYPAFLKLSERLCIVIGAGAIGARKAAELLECGARVRIVAPRAVARIEAWSAEGRVEWLRRPFEPGDIEGAALAIASTDDQEVNRAVWDAARRAGVACNVVDVPELCDFYAASSVQRGDLKIAISTNGKAPALAGALRRWLDLHLGDETEEYVERADDLRQAVRRRYPDDAAKRMETLKNLMEADELADALLRRDAALLDAIRKRWISYLSD